MRAIAALLAALLARAPSDSLSIALEIRGDTEVKALLSGPEGELSPGPFRGTISINGSAAELPISGTVTHEKGRWLLPVVVPYASVPEAWTSGFRADSFAYRLRGSSGGPPREWSGTRAWKDVDVTGKEASEFLALRNVRLVEMSVLSSEAIGELAIKNPLSFDLKIAEARYALFANDQQVGQGEARGMILHARMRNILRLPIEIEHSQLLSAAGGALLSGGEVAVRMSGRLVLRLKSGDLVVPLDLSGHLTNVS